MPSIIYGIFVMKIYTMDKSNPSIGNLAQVTYLPEDMLEHEVSINKWWGTSQNSSAQKIKSWLEFSGDLNTTAKIEDKRKDYNVGQKYLKKKKFFFGKNAIKLPKMIQF